RQLDLAIAELAEPDLRPGQVGQDGDRAAGRVCRLAHALCGKGVALGGAVREVDARHVHPGLDELTDPLDRGRSDGADELGATHCRKGRRARPHGSGVSWLDATRRTDHRGRRPCRQGRRTPPNLPPTEPDATVSGYITNDIFAERVATGCRMRREPRSGLDARLECCAGRPTPVVLPEDALSQPDRGRG